MQGADLIFCRSPRFVSRFIRFMDGGGSFSHVAVAVSDTEIVEATSKGVVRRDIGFWSEDVERAVYTPIMDEEDRLDVIRQAERIHAGGWRYNWASFFGMWLYWLTGGRLAVSAGAKAAICSALASDCLHAGGEYFDVHPLFMTPRLLAEKYSVTPDRET